MQMTAYQQDLFGTETEVKYKVTQAAGTKRELAYNPRGGTTKRSCKLCQHIRRCHYHDKNYYKCVVVGFSHGPATDVRLRGICLQFSRKKAENEAPC